MIHPRFVSAGGYLYFVAGLFLAAGWLTAPDLPTAPDRSLEFAIGANSARWRIGTTLILVATALELVASFGLFSLLLDRGKEGIGLVGFLLTVLAGALFLPVVGVFMIVLPIAGDLIQTGQPDALNVIDGYYTEPTSYVPFLAGFLFQLRSVVLGYGVWAMGTTMRWSGALLGLGGALMIPAFFDIAVMQIIAPLALAAGMAWVGWGMGLRWPCSAEQRRIEQAVSEPNSP